MDVFHIIYEAEISCLIPFYNGNTQNSMSARTVPLSGNTTTIV